MKSPRQTPDPHAEVSTTGHAWDGIEEYNNPLPRWWLYTFYITIVWAIGFTFLFPAWPLIRQATPGLLGYSSRGAVAAEIARVDAANAEVRTRLETVDLTAIAADPQLDSYARNAGAAVFRTYCSQCHGAGAAGVQASGYPNLLDDDWLWGGDIDSIHTTIAHGIRNETDPDARYSQMPAFGEILSRDEIAGLVQYVLAMSGQEHDAAAAEAAQPLFVENCASCHLEDGAGDRAQGAPRLTDAIWLYGGDEASLTQTITYARFGVMPAWAGRLRDADIRAVAHYVHSLGGGEPPPAE